MHSPSKSRSENDRPPVNVDPVPIDLTSEVADTYQKDSAPNHDNGLKKKDTATNDAEALTKVPSQKEDPECKGQKEVLAPNNLISEGKDPKNIIPITHIGSPEQNQQPTGHDHAGTKNDGFPQKGQHQLHSLPVNKDQNISADKRGETDDGELKKAERDESGAEQISTEDDDSKLEENGENNPILSSNLKTTTPNNKKQTKSCTELSASAESLNKMRQPEEEEKTNSASSSHACSTDSTHSSHSVVSADKKENKSNTERKTAEIMEESIQPKGTSETIINNEIQYKDETKTLSKNVSQFCTTIEDDSNHNQSNEKSQLSQMEDDDDGSGQKQQKATLPSQIKDLFYNNSKHDILSETNLPIIMEQYFKSAAKTFKEELPTEQESDKIMEETNLSLVEIDKWFLLNYIKNKGGSITMENVSFARSWLKRGGQKKKSFQLTKEEEESISEATGLSEYWIKELFFFRITDELETPAHDNKPCNGQGQEKVENMAHCKDENEATDRIQVMTARKEQNNSVNSIFDKLDKQEEEVSTLMTPTSSGSNEISTSSVSNEISADSTTLNKEALSSTCNNSAPQTSQLCATVKGKQAKVKVTPVYAEKEVYLMDWVKRHDGNLLPSKDMKQTISTETGMSVLSITRWFGEQIRREEADNYVMSEGSEGALTIHEYLEDWVEKHLGDTYPTLGQIEMIGRVTGLSEGRIQLWFSKHRQRKKNESIQLAPRHNQRLRRSTANYALPNESDDDTGARSGADSNDDTNSDTNDGFDGEANPIPDTSTIKLKKSCPEESAKNSNTEMNGYKLEAPKNPLDWSMDNFSDDIVQHVLSFVSWTSLEHLVAFGMTSKRSYKLLHMSVHSEMLFKSAYMNKFRLGAGNFDRVCSTWKERWENMYKIRNGLKAQFFLEEYGSGATRDEINDLKEYPLRETAGLLTANEEMHSILYDNPSHVPPGEFHYSIGYFGIDSIPTLSYIIEDGGTITAPQQPVLIWGDFEGVRIFDSLDELIYNRKGYGDTNTKQENSHSMQNTDDTISSENESDSSTKDSDMEKTRDVVNSSTQFAPISKNTSSCAKLNVDETKLLNEETCFRDKNIEGARQEAEKPYSHLKRLSKKKKNENRPRYCAVGNSDGGGQVLTVLTCPAVIGEGSKYSEGGGCLVERGPCFFLGFASGMVMAVSAVDDSDGWFKFEKTSSAILHTDEVTALTLLPTLNSSACPILASGSVDGKVFLYPHALDKDYNYSLHDSILAFANRDNTPILSMSAVKIAKDVNNELVVLCTGDQRGLLSIWSSKSPRNPVHFPQQFNNSIESQHSIWDDDDNTPRGTVPGMNSFEFRHEHFRRSPSKRGHRDVIITHVQFTHNNTLIAGDNIGDVCIWDLSIESNEDTNINLQEAPGILSQEQSGDVKPRLNLRYNISSAHSGTIEWMKICGDMVLTSGGNDGQIKGWDLASGELLGSVTCHAGKMYPPAPDPIPEEYEHACKGRRPKFFQLRSAVVGSLPHPNKPYLISLCRDGTLNYWNFDSAGDYGKELGGDARNGRLLTPKAPVNGGNTPKNADALRSIMIDEHKGDFSVELREKMKLCIIQCAINLSKSPDIKNTTFIGADGILYDNLKGAFTKYSGMGACQECKNAAQGAFICRIKRRHSYPDYDQSKNSWKILQHLVRKGLISFDGKHADYYYSPKEPENSVISSHEQCPKEMTSTEKIQDKKGSSGQLKKNKVSPNEKSFKEASSIKKDENYCRSSQPKKVAISADEQNSKKAASKGSSKDDAESFWTCSRCTLDNSNRTKRCQACSAWRPSASQTLVSPPKPDSGWPCNNCLHKNKPQHTSCQKCQQSKERETIKKNTVEDPESKPSNSLQAVSKPVPNWICDHCSHENELRRTKCRSCLKRRHEQKECKEQGINVSDSQHGVKTPSMKKMWKCYDCEHFNNIRRYICEYCHGRSGGDILWVPPTVLPDKKAIKSSPNKSKTDSVWRCQSCDYYNSLSQRECKCCDGKRGSQIVPISSIPHWICNYCHYQNAESFKSCDNCHTSRGDQGTPLETGKRKKSSSEISGEREKNGSKSLCTKKDEGAERRQNSIGGEEQVSNSKSKRKKSSINAKLSLKSTKEKDSKLGLWFDKASNSFALWECFRCLEKNPVTCDYCQKCIAPKPGSRKRMLPEDELTACVMPTKSAEAESESSTEVTVTRPSWKCDNCSRRNTGSINTCGKCCKFQSVSKRGKKRKDLRFSRGKLGESEQPKAKKTPSKGDDPRNEISTCNGDWKCSKCTYINISDSFSCAICGSHKRSRRRS